MTFTDAETAGLDWALRRAHTEGSTWVLAQNTGRGGR